MANQASAKENFEQQVAHNSARMADLQDQQYDFDVTRSLVLCFSSAEEDCARALNKALFAKGMRVLQQDPEARDDERFHIRVGVKRSVRDAVRQEFVSDLVDTAAAMNGSFDGWSLMNDGEPEHAQAATDTPDA